MPLPEAVVLASPTVLRLPGIDHDGALLTPYADALAAMEALTERPAAAPDLLICVQHPPTITVGRRGGHDQIRRRTMHGADGTTVEVQVHEVARGGNVTWHGPGQLVIYPVVRLTALDGPVGRGPIGDLPAFVRQLEDAMVATCAVFGVATTTRIGFSGVWLDERTKLASIGVGVRNGWTFHGLALNVEPRLEGFDLITPCGLDGVRMTSVRRELERARLPVPAYAEVEAELCRQLQARLRRRANAPSTAPHAVGAQQTSSCSGGRPAAS